MITSSNRLLLAATLLLVPACFSVNPADGTVKCNTGSRPCPSGYFCGGDSYCYKNGHTPAAAPSCTDARKDGDETDVDCGGSCPACAVGQACSMAADCTTSLCQMNVCAMPPPQCTNGVQDPGESDVDCGGSVCPACANDKACGADSDCVSTMCNPTTHVCYDRCNDGQKDGDETDVDCGGSCKSKCIAPQTCGLPADCATGICTGGFCVATSGTPNWVKVLDYPAAYVQYWNQSAVGPDGKIYLVGGCTAATTAITSPGTNCGYTTYPSYVYDAATNTMTYGIPLSASTEARALGGAAVVGNKLYLMGGLTSDSSGTNTTVTQVDAYDFTAKTWATNVGDIGTGTSNIQFPAVVAGPANDIFFLGGKSCIQGCGQSPYTAENYDFSTATSVFDKTAPAMPYHVSATGAVVPGDGNLYLFMGECNAYSCPTPADLNSVQIYNIAAKQWATYQKPIQLPTQRSAVTAVVGSDGRIYVIGGQLGLGTSSTATVEAYTPKTNNWATVASLNKGAGWMAAALGPDGRIYALGGLTVDTTTSTYTMRNIVEAYGPILSLVSSHGSAGSTQALSGSNFAANAVVSIYFGSQKVGTAQTDASGQLPGNVTYQVPNVAAGSYQIKVLDNLSAYPVYASFTVQ